MGELVRQSAVMSILLSCLVGSAASPLRGQSVTGGGGREQVFGTSWGVASYGMKRTWSSYSSPFGVGYGYGYPPSGFVPGKFGVELWRPNEVVPAGVYGVNYRYRTFPYPYPAGPPAYGPSIGVYAPGFGPELRSSGSR